MFLPKDKKLFKHIFILAIPVIISNISRVLMGLIDTIMVGHLGASAIAAVGMASMVTWAAMSIGIAFRTGTQTVVSRRLGQKKYKECGIAFRNMHFFVFLFGIPLTYLCYSNTTQIMSFFLKEETTLKLCIEYSLYIYLSLYFIYASFVFQGFYTGIEKTKIHMKVVLASNVLNFYLNTGLIFGSNKIDKFLSDSSFVFFEFLWVPFNFPELGVKGAAIGTLVSRIIMFIFLFFLLYKRDVIRKYILYIFKFIIDTEMIKKIISLGFPTSLQMLFEVGIFTAAIWLSGLLGEITQAANQIVLNISSMTFMIASGLSVSAAIRAGNQKGLNNYNELKRISLSILLLGIIFAMVFSLLIFFFRSALPYIYIDISDSLNYDKNLEIVSKAATLFIVVSLFQLFDSAQVIILGTLRGMQDVIIPTVIVFIAYWVVGFPVSYYYGDISQYKEIGIWFGLLCGLLFSSVFLYLRFIYLTNRMIKNAK